MVEIKSIHSFILFKFIYLAATSTSNSKTCESWDEMWNVRVSNQGSISETVGAPGRQENDIGLWLSSYTARSFGFELIRHQSPSHPQLWAPIH